MHHTDYELDLVKENRQNGDIERLPICVLGSSTSDLYLLCIRSLPIFHKCRCKTSKVFFLNLHARPSYPYSGNAYIFFTLQKT